MIDAFSFLEDFGDGEQPWCDLTFNAKAKKSFFSNRTTVRMVASAHGTPIGITVHLSAKDWRFVPAADDNSIDLWWGKVTLESDGATSDDLLSTWRTYFEIDGPKKFASRIDCQAVALEGNPSRMVDQIVRTKLFFDNGDPDQYAELYFNIDAPGGFAALNEKDPEYREPLMAWCSGTFRNA